MSERIGPAGTANTPARVLVADDDPAIVDVIKIVLEDEGYQVTTTVDGATVKKVHRDLPHLILLDIWMSGMDGREIARQLKRQPATRHIPIVMISANRDTERMAREAGADGFLAKPFDINDLVALARRHLAGITGGQYGRS